MDSPTFDRLTRTVARPTSRRGALRGLGGLGAAAIGAGLTMRHATAQEATPPPRTDTDAEFMFVQIAEAGSWRPKEGEPGVYLLTLDDVAQETVYFSDRPDRIVGTVPTQTFLDALGFTPADPPNAALVVQTDAGQDVLVVELLNPTYDAATTQLTYEALVLPPSEAGEGLGHLAAQQADLELPERFGAVSLFIDDCPDIQYCMHLIGDLDEIVGAIPGGPYGRCWSWSDFNCNPCQHDVAYYNELCNRNYSECNGQCYVGCWAGLCHG